MQDIGSIVAVAIGGLSTVSSILAIILFVYQYKKEPDLQIFLKKSGKVILLLALKILMYSVYAYLFIVSVTGISVFSISKVSSYSFDAQAAPEALPQTFNIVIIIACCIFGVIKTSRGLKEVPSSSAKKAPVKQEKNGSESK